MQKQKIQQAKEKAINHHDCSFNCAESVFMAIVEIYSEDNGAENLTPAVATAFGAGIGRTGRICGAASGGVLALSFLFGRESPDQSEEYSDLCDMVHKGLDRFEREFGFADCESLTGYDFSTAIAWNKFQEDHERREKCGEYVKRATEVFAQIVCERGWEDS